MSDAATAAAPQAGPNAAPGEDDARLVSANRPLLLAAVMAAMVMQVLDTTIANVALPHMQSSLSATTDTITWVLTSYVLASAIALPATGWLVERVGLRTVFTGSVMAFTAASVLCGLAQNMTEMVLFRVMQGLAGAFLAPLAQTTMLDVSTAEERPKMMILFSQGILLGPIVGPVLGGYITESFSWRWVFLINVPAGVVVTLLLLALLPRSEAKRHSFDLTGWALLAMAVASFQLMLDRGASQDWFDSAEIVTYAVLSACGFWMSVVHLATRRKALFPRELFGDANLIVSLVFTFILGAVLMSVMSLLPGLLQQIYGYPAIDAGWLMAPRGLGMLIAMSVIGKPISRLDPRLAISIGLFIIGTSMWMMAGWTADMPAFDIFATGLLQGLGISFMFMPLNILAFVTLPGRMRTHATSLMNLVRNLGQSIGIAVCTVLLSRNIQINHAELGARITRYSFPMDPDWLALLGDTGQSAMAALNAMVTEQAAMIAYLNDFYFIAVMCWGAIPLIFFARKPDKPRA